MERTRAENIEKEMREREQRRKDLYIEERKRERNEKCNREGES